MQKLISMLTLLSALFFACGNPSQEASKPVPGGLAAADCLPFKTGTFQRNEPPFGNFILTRTADKQTETNPQTGLEVEFDLTWTGDCSYKLVFSKILKNPQGLSVGPVLEGLEINATISKRRGNGYVETSTSNKNGEAQEQEIMVVE